jgi:MtrB/PioB family decaheme-associated outer membrane protein
MNTKSGILSVLATALLACGGALAPSGATAADQEVFKAEPVAVAWWHHGYVEAGARGFLNNPQCCGIKALGGDSLAKYYEYSTVKPGPFLYAWGVAGSKDGRYLVDFWAKNVGYSDQAYELDASKAGRYYISVGWDQTPHVYSTSAQTLYNGVGSTRLTLPPGLSNQMFVDAGCTPGPAGCGNPITAANAAKVRQDILNNTHLTGLGIRRDTASVEYRYTPDDAWDFRANYSHMRRTGTQVDGVVFSPGTTGVRVDAPKPVADTTQNYGASGEYFGTTFWNQKYNIKIAYAGSTYTDDASSYTVENPFCPTGAVNATCARNGSVSAPIALMSLWPSNQANGTSATFGVDLPFQSRYMSTVAYTNMRQNQPFLPFTLTPFSTTGGVPTGWVGGPTPVNSTAALPAQSLNGNINTLLINNVLTTQLTSDLKGKVSYRLYNYDNGTPELKFADWVLTDAVSAKATTAAYAPVQSISISYLRQNAGGELNWRPSREWNLGAAYGFERYNWIRADANATNENSGRVYADWKPVNWVTARISASAAARRFEQYDYLGFVGATQWPVAGNSRYSIAYRQFMFDNRDQFKVKSSLDIDLARNVTLTPTLAWRHDEYLLNPTTQVGLQDDKATSFGAELTYLPDPNTRFLLSYMRDRRQQWISSAGQGVPPFAVGAYYNVHSEDAVDTIIAAVQQTVVPNKLDVSLSYTFMKANNYQPLIFLNGTEPSAATGGQYPDVRTIFQRLEAMARYTFDDDFVRRMGWTGKVYARVRYAWERNSVMNWQNDSMQTYMYSSAFTAVGYMTWLAWNNPNYNVHVLGGSLSFAW